MLHVTDASAGDKDGLLENRFFLQSKEKVVFNPIRIPFSFETFFTIGYTRMLLVKGDCIVGRGQCDSDVRLSKKR